MSFVASSFESVVEMVALAQRKKLVTPSISVAFNIGKTP